MGISDNVAEYILRLIEDENGVAEIQRNELASSIGCVPSQINYVITSRFTPEQGYIVESRRGGGGFIRITRRFGSNLLMHIINSIGYSLDSATVRVMIKNMVNSQAITITEARVLSAAVSDQTLSALPKEMRDAVRASVFKNILLAMRSE